MCIIFTETKRLKCEGNEKKESEVSHVRLFVTPWTVAYQ